MCLTHSLFSALVLLLAFAFSSYAAPARSVSKTAKGVIAAFVEGRNKDETLNVITRNRSILKHLWKKCVNDKSGCLDPDIILFHEASYPEANKVSIQKSTPELPLKFVQVNIGGHGVKYSNGTGIQIYPHCRWGRVCRLFATFGSFNNINRFWFMGVFEHLQEYDWLLRLHTECELLGPSQGILASKIANIDAQNDGFVASPAWMPLDAQLWNKLAYKGPGGLLSYGMPEFIAEFSRNNSLNQSRLDSVYAPLMKVAYFNLRWFREGRTLAANGMHSHHVVKHWMKAVDESNCIYSSSWTEVTMWGTALGLIEQPLQFLNLTVFVGGDSNFTLSAKTRSGGAHWPLTSKKLSVFADTPSGVISSRIAYDGRRRVHTATHV